MVANQFVTIRQITSNTVIKGFFMMKEKLMLGKRKLFITYLLIISCLIMFYPYDVMASEVQVITDDTIIAKIKNMETGEVIILDADDITLTRTVEKETNGIMRCKSINNVSSNEIITDSYTVKFEIPFVEESKTRSSASSSKDENYVTATGTVVYQKNGDYITISRCYGGWSTSMQYLYMTDREVWLHSGEPGGQYLKENPMM